VGLDHPKYDVALSFLAQDEALAAALTDELSKRFSVFFFPRKQDDLAGTDGTESMRRARSSRRSCCSRSGQRPRPSAYRRVWMACFTTPNTCSSSPTGTQTG